MTTPADAERRTPPDRNALLAARARVCVRLALGGDLRWLSHHNEMRMLERALSRAGWPLWFSEGFNPRPNLVLPLPRSTGVASRSEWLLTDLRSAQPVDWLSERLRAVLPTGVELLALTCPVARSVPQALGVAYEVALDAADRDAAPARIAAWLAHTSCEAERSRGPGSDSIRVDIRPHVTSLECRAGVLLMNLSIARGRTARPTEVLTALGMDARRYLPRICRSEVIWDRDPQRPPERPADSERNSLGQEKSEDGAAHDAQARRDDDE